MIKTRDRLSPVPAPALPIIGAARAYRDVAGLFLLAFGPSVLNAARSGWLVVTGTPPGWLGWWTPLTARAVDLAVYGLGLAWLAAILPWRRIRPELAAAGLTGLVAVMTAAHALAHRAPSAATSLAYLAWAVLVVGLAVALVARRGMPARRLGIGRPPTVERVAAYRVGRDVALAAICGFTVASIVARLLIAIPGVPAPPTGFQVNGLHNLVAMLTASMHAGVTEELIFVGVLVTLLEAARRPVWEIYATSLTLRLAIHLYFGLAAPAALILAATNVWLFRRTRRLAPIVVAHVAVDQIGALQLVAGPAAVVLLAAAVWALDGLIVRRLNRQPVTQQQAR